MHLEPLKPKTPASYSLTSSAMGRLVQIALLTAQPGLHAEGARAMPLAVNFCPIGRLQLQITAIGGA